MDLELCSMLNKPRNTHDYLIQDIFLSVPEADIISFSSRPGHGSLPLSGLPVEDIYTNEITVARVISM